MNPLPLANKLEDLLSHIIILEALSWRVDLSPEERAEFTSTIDQLKDLCRNLGFEAEAQE